jgi:hypothetical protein
MVESRTKPAAVGVKFEADGSARRFPGNTIIRHVDPGSALMAALTMAHEEFRRVDDGRRLALLPPSSYHMTIFEGVCDQVRTAARWPVDTPADLALDELTARFRATLAELRHGCALPFRLRAVPPIAKWGPLVLALEPADDAENRKLRGLRNRLADALRLRTPDHEDYAFHITLAYAVDWPDEALDAALREAYARLADQANQDGGVSFGAPEFCVFDDMTEFRRLLLLAD